MGAPLSTRLRFADMSAERPATARAELARCAGTQFDSRVVEAFLRVLEAPSSERGLRLVR